MHFVFSISLGKIFPDLREALQVTRGKFEELISPLLMRTISLVKLALAESGFKPNEIDEAIFSILKFCIICYTNISTFLMPLMRGKCFLGAYGWGHFTYSSGHQTAHKGAGI